MDRLGHPCVRVMADHFENPKSEARNSNQIQNSIVQDARHECRFENLCFEFVLDFGFRDSDFGAGID
jgi:hypothetical protein